MSNKNEHKKRRVVAKTKSCRPREQKRRSWGCIKGTERRTCRIKRVKTSQSIITPSGLRSQTLSGVLITSCLESWRSWQRRGVYLSLSLSDKHSFLPLLTPLLHPRVLFTLKFSWLLLGGIKFFFNFLLERFSNCLTLALISFFIFWNLHVNCAFIFDTLVGVIQSTAAAGISEIP